MDHDLGISTSAQATGTGKRGSESLDGASDAGGAPVGEKRRKQKFPRKVLSCSVCVRRKTKCNHQVPCDQCLKRGEPEACVVEGAPIRNPPAPFVQGGGPILDYELRARVAVLEQTVKSLAARLPGQSSISTTPAPRPPGRLQSGNSTLDDLFDLLPVPSVTQELYESFLERADTCLHILHLGTLSEDMGTLAALQSAPSMLPDGVTSLPSWLIPRMPHFFMVMTLGLYFLPSSPSYSKPDQLSNWVNATERALTLAEWSAKPQLRTIQTILLLTLYWRNTGEIDRLSLWLAAGVRIARSLDLHKPEPALEAVMGVTTPGPSNTFRPLYFLRQFGTQLWWLLVALEWDISARCRGAPTILVQDFHLSPPLNLNDLDLVHGPGVEPRPLAEWTMASHTIYHTNMCLVTEQWMFLRTSKDEWRSRVPDTETSTIYLMHGVHQELAGRFPPFYHLTAPVEGLSPKIIFQCLDLNKDLHIRCLRLHRRNIVSDPTADPTIAHSQKSGLESATIILAIIEDVHQRFDFAAQLWWTSSYAILASTLLLLHALSVALPPTRSPALLLSTPRTEHAVQGHRLLSILYAAALASTPIEAVTLKHIADVTSKGTMSTGKMETEWLSALADELEISGISDGRVVATPLPTESYGGVQGFGTGWSPAEYDDFFKELGFLPGGDATVTEEAESVILPTPGAIW